MKLRFSSKKGKSHGLSVTENVLTFCCVKPVIIQSGEIQKVPIGITCQIPKGYTLIISTCTDLAKKAGEVFPALITLYHTYTEEVVIPVRNNGRNPLSIMAGTIIAKGHLSKVEKLELQELDPKELIPSAEKSKPQKKDPFTFEVK